MSNNLALLAARIFLVPLFLVSGVGILAAPGGFAGYMASLGLPAPMLVTWLVIAIKVLGSVAVLVGFQTRLASYAIAAFAIGAALLGHFDFADQNQITQFMKNLAVAGGFLALSAAGPGAYSLDARRGAAPVYA
jgi:putative oxidoreductase